MGAWWERSISAYMREAKMRAKYRWLSGDVNPRDHGGKWWRPYYKGDLDTIEIMEVQRWDEHVSSEEIKGSKLPTYLVTVRSITLSLYSDRDKEAAANCWGLSPAGFRDLAPQYQAEIMISYGLGETYLDLGGNNYRKLLQQARNA